MIPIRSISALLVVLCIASGCKKPIVIVDPATFQYLDTGTGIVGTKGGEVYIGTQGLPISNAVCTFPAGTLAQPITISISNASANLQIPGFPNAVIINIQPDTASINGMVTIGMSYSHLDFFHTDRIKIYSLNPTTYGLTELSDMDLDITKKVLYGKTNRLGYFTILQLAVSEITTGTFIDARDNQTYGWLKVGEQTWMSENLRFNVTGSYCYSENTAECDLYGRLYNWTAAIDACPSGWHLPTDAEWKVLEQKLLMNQPDADAQNWRSTGEAGKKLKSKTGWFNNGNGTDEIQFKALPGGFREQNGTYQYALESARFWTSTISDTGNNAWIRFLEYKEAGIYRATRGWARGYSVRCVQGKTSAVAEVITTSVTAITSKSAQSGGTVVLSGQSPVIARGVCWNTAGTPTQYDAKTSDGSGTGSFISQLTGLVPKTTYYVRAYVTNSAGTAYGNEHIFTTSDNLVVETGTVVDTRDNQSYPTVKIGNDWWLSKNLDYPTNQGSWCYNQLSSNCVTYGRLYNWETASDACMPGWHLASDGEWQAAESQLGMSATELAQLNWRASGSVGAKLKSIAGWESNGNGSNESGFNALPGGFRDGDGTYTYVGTAARYWTSTITTGTDPWIRYLENTQIGTFRSTRGINRAFSVRCVKGTIATLPTITTSAVSAITSTTAQCGGNVTSTGGSAVVSRGVCWNTTGNPLRNEFNTQDGSGTGSFISLIQNLLPATTYYARAYATNASGTVYGEQRTFLTANSAIVETGTMTDARDQRNYKTVKVGNNWWMAENLKFTPATGSWCYSDVASNCSLYGRLYDWTAASAACPVGWHLPTDIEWIALETSLGLPAALGSQEGWRSTGDVGLKLKSTAGWNTNGNGTNESKFSAVPGGFRDGDGVYNYLGESARFWTAAKNTTGDPWVRYLQSDQTGIYRIGRSTNRGMSVRCMKD